MRLGITFDLRDFNHRLPIAPDLRVILIDIVAPDVSVSNIDPFEILELWGIAMKLPPVALLSPLAVHKSLGKELRQNRTAQRSALVQRQYRPSQCGAD